MLKHVSLYVVCSASLWAATAMAVAQLAPLDFLQTWIARQMQEGIYIALIFQAVTVLFVLISLRALYDQLSEAVASYAYPIAH